MFTYKTFPLLRSKFILIKVTEISSKRVKKVPAVPKTAHFQKVSTLPITVLKSEVPRHCPTLLAVLGGSR